MLLRGTPPRHSRQTAAISQKETGPCPGAIERPGRAARERAPNRPSPYREIGGSPSPESPAHPSLSPISAFHSKVAIVTFGSHAVLRGSSMTAAQRQQHIRQLLMRRSAQAEGSNGD